MDIEKRLDGIESSLSAQSQRIQALERWRGDQRVDDAVRTERDKHMDQRFDKLEAAVGEVKGYLLKIVWLIVAGILAALITFIVNGGLTIAP